MRYSTLKTQQEHVLRERSLKVLCVQLSCQVVGDMITEITAGGEQSLFAAAAAAHCRAERASERYLGRQITAHCLLITAQLTAAPTVSVHLHTFNLHRVGGFPCAPRETARTLPSRALPFPARLCNMCDSKSK